MRTVVLYDSSTESVRITVPEGLVSGFMNCPAMVINHASSRVDIRDVIRFNSITLLFFGNSECQDTMDILPELKDMIEEAQFANRKVDVIYIPAYSRSSDLMDQWEERSFFMKYHGNWWMLEIAPSKCKLAKAMHWVKGVPAIVMLRSNGVIMERHAERDIIRLRDMVLHN